MPTRGQMWMEQNDQLILQIFVKQSPPLQLVAAKERAS